MEYRFMDMDEEQTELMKRAMAYYIDLRMGEDCTCLPDHDACDFCKNKNAYHRLHRIVEIIENGDWAEDADDILNEYSPPQMVELLTLAPKDFSQNPEIFKLELSFRSIKKPQT